MNKIEKAMQEVIHFSVLMDEEEATDVKIGNKEVAKSFSKAIDVLFEAGVLKLPEDDDL